MQRARSGGTSATAIVGRARRRFARALQSDSGRPADRVHLERALDPLRVGALRAARGAGSTRASSACSAGQPSTAARASRRARTRDRPPATPRVPRQRLEVQHRPADQQRIAPRERIAAIAAIASARKRAAEYASSGSRMSIR
jgi:hypothetical protein